MTVSHFVQLNLDPRRQTVFVVIDGAPPVEFLDILEFDGRFLAFDAKTTKRGEPGESVEDFAARIVAGNKFPKRKKK